jgi:tRNA dimethylallyltransferase
VSDEPRVLPPGIDLYILTGPTAVGKTELALSWAEAFGAEIVSADSLLFYRGMDIGTAKPSEKNLARVPHHLIDVREAGEPWDIQGYVAAAAAKVAEIHGRGRRVLITGGSGFYLKSFLAPVVDQVQVPPEVLRQVASLEEGGRDALAAGLVAVDPSAGDWVDLQNPRRVARALERCLATGKSVRQLREEMAAKPFPFMWCRPRVVLLLRERAELRARIARRVDEMLEAGLVGEVAHLLKKGLEHNPSAASAIGYRETIRYLAGELSAERLREEIICNTGRLVKKQLTWFRYQLPLDTRTICLTGDEMPAVADVF